MNYKSILNDVIGPVTTGPSSSHTAAPARIGRAVYDLWGKEINKAVIVYDEKGSYPQTHRGQGADMGFTGGLMGYFPDSPELRNSESQAKKQGLEIGFTEADLGAQHPNEARIDIYGEKGIPELSVLSFSTGGGTMQLVEMDGYPILFEGWRKATYLACRTGAQEQLIERELSSMRALYHKRLPEASRVTYHTVPDVQSVLFEIDTLSASDPDSLTALANRANVLYYRTADMLVPVPIRLLPAPPFRNAAEALALAGNTGGTMAELAIDYECGLGNVSREEVREKMAYVLDVMRASMIAPALEDAATNGVMGRNAARMETLLEAGRLVDIGLLKKSMAAAVAVMENSNARRIIVAAPTAGSSGIIPAAVIAVGEQMGLDDSRIIDGLLAAGLVGSFIANYATFGAEVAGCQAEVGSASCMAAAGVVQLMNGSVSEGFRAAAIAMQSFLGLICDPVGGISEIPCIERNATAAAVSAMAANMALCGFDPMIPLDETIETMLKVGQSIPEELRCTCKGGLCTTPSGRILNDIIKGKCC